MDDEPDDRSEDDAAARPQRGLLGLALSAPAAIIRAAVRAEQQGQKMLLPAAPEAPPAPAMPRKRPAEGGAGVVLDALLEKALLQTSRDAEDALATAILLNLVPDEARMLTTLTRSGWAAAVDVTPRGGRVEGALHGATLLGRHSGVALLEHTPTYLTRLVVMGLVEPTEERTGHEQEYEILLAEPAVLRAVKAGRNGARGPAVRRYGVTPSALGQLVLRVGGAETPAR